MSEAKNKEELSAYTLAHPAYRELDVADHPDGIAIRLIEPDLAYASDSLKWLSQADVGQHMGADFSDLSMEGEDKRLQEIMDDTDQYNWMIEADGKVIGNVSINSIEQASKKHACKAGSMAILIGDKALWGKKIARYVNKAVIDWAFSEGGFDELHARIMRENIASIKSFAALGFESKDIEVEEINGKTIHWEHSKIARTEWLKMQENADNKNGFGENLKK